MEGIDDGTSRRGRVQGHGVDELRKEAADLGEGGDEALVERVVGCAHQRRHRPQRPGDRLPVLAQGVDHDGYGLLVVEGVKEGLHPRS
jgi:hypothetical protein